MRHRGGNAVGGLDMIEFQRIRETFLLQAGHIQHVTAIDRFLQSGHGVDGQPGATSLGHIMGRQFQTAGGHGEQTHAKMAKRMQKAVYGAAIAQIAGERHRQFTRAIQQSGK